MLIRIMGCREREYNINKMLSSLPAETEVILDADHNPCHTLCRVVDSDEPMLVMEDDIELCKDFYEKAKAEIKQRPDSFIMFYLSDRSEEQEIMNKRNGRPYNRPFVSTQAYYIPAGIGRRLSKFLETNERANNHRWSRWINEFLIQEWIKRYWTCPSLVQHIWKESLNEPDKPFERLKHQSGTYRYE